MEGESFPAHLGNKAQAKDMDYMLYGLLHLPSDRLTVALPELENVKTNE